tara:strand:+ start:447 stop:1619 length:1173 start_codon:yes stop_codon:yes gene_type:complete
MLKVFNQSKFFCYFLVFLFFTSCSLVKIESEQKPLKEKDLNIRILVQSFVAEASQRIELAADSIKNSSQDLTLQKNALKWKLNAIKELKRIGFQTTPKIALLDTWSYLLQEKNLLKSAAPSTYFKNYDTLVKTVNYTNLSKIKSIAKKMLAQKDFINYSALTEKFAQNSPISYKNPIHTSIRDEYYASAGDRGDGLQTETVGTLSEVVSDLSNKLFYTSEFTPKTIQWDLELLLLENGLNSESMDSLITAYNENISFLMDAIENSPESIDNAIITFRKQLHPLFSNLGNSLIISMNNLREERQALDILVARERSYFYQKFSSERKILTEEANVLSKNLVETAMEQVKGIIKSILIYLIILLIILLFVPFSFGYIIGKRTGKRKNYKQKVL